MGKKSMRSLPTVSLKQMESAQDDKQIWRNDRKNIIDKDMLMANTLEAGWVWRIWRYEKPSLMRMSEEEEHLQPMIIERYAVFNRQHLFLHNVTLWLIFLLFCFALLYF